MVQRASLVPNWEVVSDQLLDSYRASLVVGGEAFTRGEARQNGYQCGYRTAVREIRKWLAKDSSQKLATRILKWYIDEKKQLETYTQYGVPYEIGWREGMLFAYEEVNKLAKLRIDFAARTIAGASLNPPVQRREPEEPRYGKRRMSLEEFDRRLHGSDYTLQGKRFKHVRGDSEDIGEERRIGL
jgi:hypothetical protein